MAKIRRKQRWGTTADMMVALTKRYDRKAYAVMANVANGTGHGANSWADLIAVSLWPSRGLEIIGHELKASRADWLRELKNPRKNADFIQYCHRWYLVVSGPEIVKPGELPANWGLLQLKGKVLHGVTEAPALTPLPPTLDFFCAIMRNSSNAMVTVEEFMAHGKEQREQGIEEGKRLMVQPEDRSADNYREAYEKVLAKVHAFEKASGMSFHDYHGIENVKHLGVLARLLRDRREYESWVDHAKKRAKAARKEADAYEELAGKFETLGKTLPEAPYVPYNGPSFEELMGLPPAPKQTQLDADADEF